VSSDLIFLFGLSGAGKSYCGKLFAERSGYYFYDLDADMTPAMQQAIREGRSFTDQIRDEFFEVVCKRIGELKLERPKIIFAQGAYKERHRDQVRAAHPGIEFIWIDAPNDVIVSRIKARGIGVSRAYADSIRAHFEAPLSGGRVVNDGTPDDALWERFRACAGS
jgi:gluconate kinase